MPAILGCDELKVTVVDATQLDALRAFANPSAIRLRTHCHSEVCYPNPA